MNLRQQQAIDTQNKIMAVSEQLFEEYGFENVSVDQICECANISKGGFYHHFESKNTLIALLIGNDLDHELGTQILPLIGKYTAFELLEKYVNILIDYHETRQSNIITKYWQTLAETDNIDQAVKKRYAFTVMDAIVEQGQKNGEINKQYSVQFCTHFLTGTITGLFIHWDGYHGTYDLRSFVEKSLPLIFQPLCHS